MNKKEYGKQYYKLHKEKLSSYSREYNKNHKKERNEYNRNWYHNNKKRVSEYRKEYRNKNKERVDKRNRKSQIKHFYGLTNEELIELFNKQNDCCAICGKHKDNFKRSLHIDHDHSTGKIRGLLCYKCNQMLGFAEDNIEILNKAIDYLIENQQ